MSNLKLKRAIGLSINNISRESITEVEIFVNTVKAFLQKEEDTIFLDAVFSSLRNRLLDISGEEARRLNRYLETWQVRQTSQELDWVEYGSRLNTNKTKIEEGDF